jgi:hypothetical protein
MNAVRIYTGFNIVSLPNLSKWIRGSARDWYIHSVAQVFKLLGLRVRQTRNPRLLGPRSQPLQPLARTDIPEPAVRGKSAEITWRGANALNDMTSGGLFESKHRDGHL